MATTVNKAKIIRDCNIHLNCDNIPRQNRRDVFMSGVIVDEEMANKTLDFHIKKTRIAHSASTKGGDSFFILSVPCNYKYIKPREKKEKKR